ncbi:MAG: polysaccharide deacetylase family protein [Cyclobacteriaceae bacterium]
MIPYKTPNILRQYYKDLVWQIPTDEKTIYLTFDDGPVPELTPTVVDVLKKYNAKATFFCVGDNVHKHPEVIQQVLEAGHSVGNHTHNHLKGWSTPDQAYFDNIDQCDTTLSEVYPGYVGRLFRPPYGRIKKSQAEILSRKYTIIMWDVLTHDYSNFHSAEKGLKYSIRETQPGTIIVFHDNIKASEKMLYILTRYLDHFGSKGYSFKSL